MRSNGARSLARYYRHAPKILQNMRRTGEYSKEMARVLETVRLAVSSIDEGQHAQALRLYRELFLRLEDKYLHVD